MLLVLLAGCDREPAHRASYEWVDASLNTPPFPLYPGATVLAAQTELIRQARLLNRPEEAGGKIRLILYEADAPLDAVERHYVEALGAAPDQPAQVRRSHGDFAADEASIGPILARLGRDHDPAVSKGKYMTAVIEGGAGRPTVSLQRPYRDFVHDRVVDRTSILITD